MSENSQLNMYTASVPVYSRMLKACAHVLQKGEADAKERKIDEKVYLDSRLAPDMFTLTRQIQTICDNAKGAASRLAGREPPKHDDTEKSFAELYARIEKVRDYLKSFKPEEFAGAETREIVLNLQRGEMRFTGFDYLTKFALPNFFFHATAAYAILRHNGVKLVKRDFLGGGE